MQIDDAVDVSQPLDGQENDTERRMLKMVLTDGVNSVVGIEERRLSELPRQCIGQKVRSSLGLSRLSSPCNSFLCETHNSTVACYFFGVTTPKCSVDLCLRWRLRQKTALTMAHKIPFGRAETMGCCVCVHI